MSQLQLTAEIADPESALLARAYVLILSWGYPKCSKLYSCPCDVGATKDTAPDVLRDSEAKLISAMIPLPQDVIATGK
jgi:hypothetical protein